MHCPARQPAVFQDFHAASIDRHPHFQPFETPHTGHKKRGRAELFGL